MTRINKTASYPPKVFEALRTLAKRADLSMNAYLIYLIEKEAKK